ncbi:hypothetical protein ACFOHS_19800 [Jhaorihella thermophila]
MAAPASLLMAGRVTEGQFDLDPTAWLERSNSVLGRAKPIALRATGEAELRLIHGKVEGDADCETFRAYLQTPADLPISPVGILFQSRVDDAACTALGRWLAAGEVDRIGGFRFNTLILDEKAIVEVLGKPLHLWTNDDVNTFRRMTSECRGRLTQSATIEDSTLAGAIEDWTVKTLVDTCVTGSTDRLDASGPDPRHGGTKPTGEARDRIESAKALPAVFESLSRIDAWNAETERGTGELAYLRQSARLDHLAQMAEIRRMLASRIAADELARLAAYPATLEGLQDAERIKNETGARLEAYNALVAARELAAGFADMAAEKGLVVWRDFLRINTPRVVELAEADYRAFGEIRELDHTEDALMRFARPPFRAVHRKRLSRISRAQGQRSRGDGGRIAVRFAGMDRSGSFDKCGSAGCRKTCSRKPFRAACALRPPAPCKKQSPRKGRATIPRAISGRISCMA